MALSDYTEGASGPLLQELKRIVAAQIDAGPSPRDLAALSRQMLLITEKLAESEEAKPKGKLEAMRSRRNAA